jgi:hypothetical protein
MLIYSYIIPLSALVQSYPYKNAASKEILLQKIRESTQKTIDYFKNNKLEELVAVEGIRNLVIQLKVIDPKLAESLGTILPKDTIKPNSSTLSPSLIEKHRNLQNSFNRHPSLNTNQPSTIRQIDMISEAYNSLGNAPKKPTQEIERWIGLNFFKKNYGELQKEFSNFPLNKLKVIEEKVLSACDEIYDKDKGYFQGWSRELREKLSAGELSERRKTLMDYLQSLFAEHGKKELINDALFWIEICLVPLDSEKRGLSHAASPEYSRVPIKQSPLASPRSYSIQPNKHLNQSNPPLTFQSNFSSADIKIELNYLIFYFPSLDDRQDKVSELINQTSNINALILLKEVLSDAKDISFDQVARILNGTINKENLTSLIIENYEEKEISPGSTTKSIDTLASHFQKSLDSKTKPSNASISKSPLAISNKVSLENLKVDLQAMLSIYTVIGDPSVISATIDATLDIQPLMKLKEELQKKRYMTCEEFFTVIFSN